MPEHLATYILQYGYLALFCLVFFQELGVPSFPNEIVLCYFGYLSHKGILNLSLVFSVAVIADVCGASLVYTAFYFFKSFLLRIKPNWLNFVHRRLIKLKQRLSEQGNGGIFFGRCVPFVRGYTSAIAGLLRIAPAKYEFIVIATALIWTGGFTIIGWFITPYWDIVANKFKDSPNAIYLLPLLMLSVYFIIFQTSKLIKRKINRSKKIVTA